MGWLLRKIDQVVAAVLAGSVGVSLSQLQAFMHQYLQRLGGHLDEARRNFDQLGSAPQLQVLEERSRQLLLDAAAGRVGEIEQARDTILGAGPFLRPFVFVREADPEIAMAALRDFQPAIPVDAASLGYALAGVVLALLVYDLVKAPFVLASRRRRHRVH